ncbi:peptidase domain-containing ABC transporter [Hugenholtzia roseola]|uniref:peptidase domain-containing ABC transporter n=1 Tax=Hugenholtzia roseola TaxID=1002 RepID=UPI000423B90D|nr:peptidase domain-containing ABC transporter [Hugenholtzia roseola]
MPFFKKKPKFRHYTQLDQMDCGPTCLRMIARHYGKNIPIQQLRELSFIGKQGVSFLGISAAAEKIGFRTLSLKADFALLVNEVPLPCIAHWQQNHFVVIFHIEKNKKGTWIHVADPATGIVVYSQEEFCRYWLHAQNSKDGEGLLLLLEPTANFYQQEENLEKRTDLTFLYKYLIPYRRYIIQLLIGVLVGSLISLLFPFLTQAVVDYGIKTENVGFVYTILFGQLMLFLGKTAIEMIRGWILLHLSARINMAILSDFLIKLMRLPLSFFDSKNLGDLIQRMRDHDRIKVFLTSSSLSVVFSLFNLFIFSLILGIYSPLILLLFLVGSSFYVGWIFFFLKKRKQIDYKRFNQLAANQTTEVQLLTGMPEIKLNNCERQKRWEWERLQIRLFKISLKSLALSQYQNAGGFFINELKNILITFVAAGLVIKGEMTLGMMLAVSYILGQLNSPLFQLIDFIQQAQDAKISLERLAEIHNAAEEQSQAIGEAFIIPEKEDLFIRNLNFRYNDPNKDWVLNNLNLIIPRGKTTAIVGASGSGKTTLIKLLLKFYDPEMGDIRIGETTLRSIEASQWREKCGSVMQDGFIFSDTIARNIAVGEDIIDKMRLLKAVEIAQIKEFIETLPLNYNTKIGAEGVGLSGGQRQRLLIARAVYKDPEFLFFDEATSALDANNERKITEKLTEFCKGKTTIVIAHRLSTVRNADQILVLDHGQVSESGTHEDLVAKKGRYYELVKNQLELGN